MPAITLEHVSKRYATPAGPLPALEEVSLRVETGEFVALLGPSGCGKSTLLRLVAALDQLSGGDISVLGMAPEAARQARAYGIVFQRPALLDWRSAAANVALPLELARRPATERRARSRELLDLVGLGEFTGAYPRELSGGMQQRVALARALALAPPLLLLDEPFSALDELTRERLQSELLRTLAALHMPTTVLFVTHNIGEAVFLADRVLLLSPRPGRLIADIAVDLPRPRPAALRDDPRFHALVARARAALRQSG